MLEFSKGDPLMTQPLAIDGGTPVRTAAWPAWPMSDEREERLILEVLHSGKWSALHGDKVKTFQERFAAYQGAAHAVCVPNGTLALQVALMALGIQPGDEVIVPAYTFIATISTALVMGARPVFVDIDPDSYNLDVRQIAAAITPKTRRSCRCTWPAARPTWMPSWRWHASTTWPCWKTPARPGVQSGAASGWARWAAWAPSASRMVRISPRAKAGQWSRTTRPCTNRSGRCTMSGAPSGVPGITTRTWA
jgi:hypothetical protein